MEARPPQRKQEHVTFPAIYPVPDDPAQDTVDQKNMDQTGIKGIIVLPPEDVMPRQPVIDRPVKNGVAAILRWLL
jgi:hypothetical protein